MRTSTFILFLLIASSQIFSQNLPQQWRLSDDGQFITAGDKVSDGLYDESVVEEIRLYFPQPNYWTLLTNYYNSKTDIPATLKYKGVSFDSVGVRFKGQTSYFMNNTAKKSFNISMDVYKDGQKLEGYHSLNLNNSFSDASFMREVLYYRLIRKHTPSAKANFVRVYLNDQDWGIYQNVQQLNKDFLEEWYESNDGINIRADVPDGSSTGPGGGPGGGAMWGDGTAGLNYLGSDTSLYKKYYTLKSSGSSLPWTELMQACNVLNNSGAYLETEAPKMFDIDKILWHLACEIAFGDDDSYVYKGKMDYYIYKDDMTGRWASYDYDANSTLLAAHVTWSPFYNASKVNYPLLNKLLAVPTFRQRYLAHMRTIINELFDETKVNALIDTYDGLIRTGVFADSKKGTSNTAYTSELAVLKNFIKNRKAFLLTNAEVSAPSPTIINANMIVNGVTNTDVIHSNDQVVFTATVSFSAGIEKVLLYYSPGFTGRFSTLTMHDDGQDGDKTAGDGIYSVTMPTFQPGNLIRAYIEAIGADNAKSVTYFPTGAEHQMMVYSITAETAVEKTLVINEFMASNTGIIKDEAGETEDWIELFNNSNTDIDLSGYNLTDNLDNLTKFTFGSGITLKAKGYLIIWADEDQTQGPYHANFKLSASGESIILLDKNLVILDQVTYGAQTANKSAARKPNGTGDFVIGDHTFALNNDGTSSVDQTSFSEIKIYPNPASGEFRIANQNEQTLDISIIHVNGSEVLSRSIQKDESISIPDLKPGLYIIKYLDKAKKLLVLQP